MKSALTYRNRCENEASRRVYRGAGDAAQRLEQILSQVSNFHDFFSTEITDHRMRLKDNCEKLIFTDPLAFGRKAEEILWRKVHYEFFQKCRQNRKRLLESEFNRHTLRTHLLAAVGSYHHMLLRIQTEFHIDLNTKVDAPFLWHMRGLKKERWKKYQQSSAGDNAVQSWALQASHRILTYLGDLARYLSELQVKRNYAEPDESLLAERYYLQAFCLNPRSGIPHNQLASLANNTFDSAYHYMRCLASPEKFDGAESNLMLAFDKNNQSLCDVEGASDIPARVRKYRLFLVKFLKLCEIFYFTDDEDLATYYQEVLQDFDACVIPDEVSALEAASDEDIYEPICLDDERVFRVVVMCILCVAKLHERGSSDVSTAMAFTLALFSSVVHSSIKRLHSSVYENFIDGMETPVEDHPNDDTIPSDCDIKATEEMKNKMNEVNQLSCVKNSVKKPSNKFKTKRLRKMRRRRKWSSTSQEDSEISDVEVMGLADESDEDVLNSDVSQTGSCSSDTLSEHEDLAVQTNNIENGSKSTDEKYDDDVYINHINDDDAKKEKVNEENTDCINAISNNIESLCLANGSAMVFVPPERIAETLLRSAYIGTLKVLVDWLRTHEEYVMSQAESLHFLLSRLTALFNLFLKLEIELVNLRESLSELKRTGNDWLQVIPLPEDVLLQNIPSMDTLQSKLDYDISKRRDMSPLQMVFLRLQCILSFGDQLVESYNDHVAFDVGKNEYVLKVTEPPKQTDNDVKSKFRNEHDSITNNVNHQRQQLMTHLWLKSEVNHLEMSVKKSGANPQLSPLLVADTSALCHHLPLLKQLIAAKNFVVIVPRVVIDNLDQIKKKSVGAREAIRWLEFTFQKGSRHVRTQRDAERNNLHPMKYPKRKDKESWDYFQILECCNYLNQQQQQLEKTSCPLVTLLFGKNNRLPSNANALAKSLNINMENVESFFAKWRNRTKKPG